jgi:hypothetical protein
MKTGNIENYENGKFRVENLENMKTENIENNEN